MILIWIFDFTYIFGWYIGVVENDASWVNKYVGKDVIVRGDHFKLWGYCANCDGYPFIRMQIAGYKRSLVSHDS